MQNFMNILFFGLFAGTIAVNLIQSKQLNELQLNQTFLKDRLINFEYDNRNEVKELTKKAFKELIDPKTSGINENEEYLK